MRQSGSLLSHLSAVPIVALIGLGVYDQGFPLLAQCVEIWLLELIILILFSHYIPHILSNNRLSYDQFVVLLSVGIVWVYAVILTVVGAYMNTPLTTQVSILYPIQWGLPRLHVGEAFVMIAAAFGVMIESTGAFIAATRYATATHIPPSCLSRGISWLAVGIFLDGLFGTGTGFTVSVENVGLLALTRIGSRRMIQISAFFMIYFSIFGKFGAIIASIPLPIVGALYCVLFALMLF